MADTDGATNANGALPGAPSITDVPKASAPALSGNRTDLSGCRTLLEHALAYAARGWHVLPLAPRGKRPHAMLGASGGYHHATTDADQIRAWWATDPGANLAIAVAPSGLVALDVDVADGKPGETSLKEIAPQLTSTLEAETGSGGTHLIYSRPEGVEPTRKIGWCPGLDVIGDGYLILAPSVHPTGGTYSWLDESIEIAPLPQILIDACTEHEKRGAAPMQVATGSTDSIPSGSRNDALTRIAGSLRHVGQSVEAIEAALLVANQQRCDPPLPESEVSAIARSIGRYEPAIDPGDTAIKRMVDEVIAAAAPEPGSWEAELARADADVAALLGKGGRRKRRSKPMGLMGDALMRQVIASPTWLVHRLITDGGTAAIATAPKVGKTWIATEIAMGVATGTPAFGTFACRRARTAYVYLEDTARSVQSRIRALASSRGMTGEAAAANMILVPRGEVIDLLDDDQLAEIVASVRMHGGEIGLLVIDPLRDAHSAPENESDGMAPVMRRIRVIGQLLGCTVLVVHHTIKAAEGKPSPRAMRGSSAIHGSVDSGLYLEEDGSTVSELRATCVSQIKSAQSAGRLGIALSIEDGPDHTAERATWRVTVESAGTAGSGSSDAATGKVDPVDRELAEQLVYTLCSSYLAVSGDRQTGEQLRKGRGTVKRADAAIRIAVRDGLLESVLQGRKSIGYRLTPAGLEYVRQGTRMPTA